MGLAAHSVQVEGRWGQGACHMHWQSYSRSGLWAHRELFNRLFASNCLQFYVHHTSGQGAVMNMHVTAQLHASCYSLPFCYGSLRIDQLGTVFI